MFCTSMNHIICKYTMIFINRHCLKIQYFHLCISQASENTHDKIFFIYRSILSQQQKSVTFNYIKSYSKKKQCNHRPIANDFAYHTGQMSDIFTISCSQWLKVSCLNSYIQCKQNGFNNSQKGKNNHYPITSWQQTTTFFLFVCKTFW